MTSKRWFISMVLSLTVFFTVCGVCVFSFDPFMHYRIPTHGMIDLTHCEPDIERYLNSGIVRNYQFDAVIAGSSMSENFKTSEFDRLFSVHSVKLPVSGGTFKEVNDICENALIHQRDVKIVLRCMDLSGINQDKDIVQYGEYPDYLYDDNSINDIKYLLSKNALLKGCAVDVFVGLTQGRTELSFDVYANWSNKSQYGKEIILSTYNRPNKTDELSVLSAADREQIRKNIQQNIIEPAEEYPDTRFIYFLTPYSICYWDELSRSGSVQKAIQEQEEVIKLLLPYENIELYSFCDNFEMVCDLNNYKDAGHYSGDINTKILQWIAAGEYRITKDNYEEYLEKISDFYENYDYDGIFEE